MCNLFLWVNVVFLIYGVCWFGVWLSRLFSNWEVWVSCVKFLGDMFILNCLLNFDLSINVGMRDIKFVFLYFLFSLLSVFWICCMLVFMVVRELVIVFFVLLCVWILSLLFGMCLFILWMIWLILCGSVLLFVLYKMI